MPTYKGKKIPSNTWVDLYPLFNIAPYSPIVVQNIGSEPIFLCIGGNSPPTGVGDYFLLLENEKECFPFSISNIWAKSVSPEGSLLCINKDVALITQTYQEANSKAGFAFGASFNYTNPIAAGGFLNMGVTTAVDPLTIKNYSISVSGTQEIKLTLYEDSAFTSGTEINAYNRSRIIKSPPGFSCVLAPNVTNLGNQASPGAYILASGTGSNRLGLGAISPGDEINLLPNSKYILNISNLGSTSIEILTLYMLFYEGPLDYPY